MWVCEWGSHQKYINNDSKQHQNSMENLCNFVFENAMRQNTENHQK